MTLHKKNQHGGRSYLQPQFSQIPADLKLHARWIVWREGKTPWDAKFRSSKASSTDPNTWADFKQACTAFGEGGYAGVAFVLAGDGIVGVDLDDCVVDGKPTEESLAMMQYIGCEYIELSPSGNGLRGFGYVQNPPRRGLNRTINGLRVELYSTARYLTVTGHVVTAGPMAQLHGYCELHQRLAGREITEETEVTEVTEETEFYSSTELQVASSAGVFPVETLPTCVGQRNQCIFLLARHLKSTYPNGDVEAMRDLVIEWHRQVLPSIRTKEFHESWLGFTIAWRKVKFLNGTMSGILSGLDSEDGPNPGSVLGADGQKLYQLCSVLQAREGTKPFFLDCRTAGKAIGISHLYANNLLNEFCHRGLMVRTFKGVRRKASRYLLKGVQS